MSIPRFILSGNPIQVKKSSNRFKIFSYLQKSGRDKLVEAIFPLKRSGINLRRLHKKPLHCFRIFFERSGNTSKWYFQIMQTLVEGCISSSISMTTTSIIFCSRSLKSNELQTMFGRIPCINEFLKPVKKLVTL